MNSKNKGCRGERELAEALRSYGYDTRRGQQFAGGIDSPDVIGLPGIHIECKRVEKLNIDNAMDQAIRDSEGKAMPAVFHRRNRRPWMVTMLLEDFMKLYKGEGNYERHQSKNDTDK
jgi:Holliday junction resolvase